MNAADRRHRPHPLVLLAYTMPGVIGFLVYRPPMSFLPPVLASTLGIVGLLWPGSRPRLAASREAKHTSSRIRKVGVASLLSFLLFWAAVDQWTIMDPTTPWERFQLGFGKARWSLTDSVGRSYLEHDPDGAVGEWMMAEGAYERGGPARIWHGWSITLAGLLISSVYLLGSASWMVLLSLLAAPSAKTGPTILFLGAEPTHGRRLALTQEAQAIDDHLQASSHGRRFVMVQQWNVKVEEIARKLLRFRPTILHVSGHGQPGGEIILVDDRGKPVPVADQALRQLLATVGTSVRIAVLNACYSEAQARALAQTVDAVVGMHAEIGDRVAARFAATFYEHLGHGLAVQPAFDLASAVAQPSARAAGRPVLLGQRGVDLDAMTLGSSAAT